MTVFEHAANEFREGIEIVEANAGTIADADPEALIAVALCAVLVIACITIYKICR